MENNQIVFTLRQEGLRLQLNEYVVAPEEIRSIRYNGRQATVTLTHDVVRLDGYAVHNIDDVEAVALPESIDEVHCVAFSDTLEPIRLEGPLASPDGLLLIKHGRLLYYADREAREISLPEGITALADSVFRICYRLQKITLPASLRQIGAHAFDTCTALREVVWSPALQTIGDSAFIRSALQHADLPDSVQAIGAKAFACCSQLEDVHVGASARSIGVQAFSGSPVQRFTGPYATADGTLLLRGNTLLAAVASAPEIHIPEGVERIAPYAFHLCGVERPVQLPRSLKEIGHHAFCHCYVDVLLPEGLEKIDDFAFCSDGALRHVHLPDSLREIGDGAFGSCQVQRYSGRYATADGLYLVQDGRLLGVAESDSDCYEIPQGVTYIGIGAFRYLDVEARLVLPEGVTEIGRQAFDGEDGPHWTSLHLPSTLRTIGDYAFSHLHLDGPLVLPEGLEHIGQNAFEYAELGAPQVVFPTTLQTLGPRALYDVNYLQDDKPLFEFRGDNPPRLTSGSLFTDVRAIRVPRRARSRYAEAPFWTDFDLQDSAD